MNAHRDETLVRLYTPVKKLQRLTDVIAEALLDGDTASLRARGILQTDQIPVVEVPAC